MGAIPYIAINIIFFIKVKGDPELRKEEDLEPSNTKIERLVLDLQGELQDCRQEMSDIRDKLALILQDQHT